MELALLLACLCGSPLPGQADVLPYTMTGEECRNTVTEYSPTNSKLCCSRCQPGHRLRTACTATSDTVCEACPEKTYSNTMSYHTNCFRCTECDKQKNLVSTKPCTNISNSECECRPGWYCSLRHGSQPCSQCKKQPACPPGKGAVSPATPRTKVQCAACPEGTFSNETSPDPCRPHTQCEAQGRAMVHRGNSTADTVCEPNVRFVATTSDPDTTTQTTVVYHLPGASISDSRRPFTVSEVKQMANSNFILLYSVLGAVILLILLILLTTFIIRHKVVAKPPVKEDAQPGQASDSKAESELLLADGKTSTSCASSTSDSHSQSTGASQDSIHTEQPVVSSPYVNFNFTINCQLNQPTGSCSIPICPQTQTQPQPGPQTGPQTKPQAQPVQPDLPLSQEEQLHVSCEEENSKDAVQSVTESGMTVY